MRSNWRGYTYVDEMRSHALLQLSQIGLQFNELKSENPFAYYTAAVTNSFTRVLNLEKRNQNIRDDHCKKLVKPQVGHAQIEHEMAERAKWDEKADKERKEHGSQYQVDKECYETILNKNCNPGYMNNLIF